MKLKNFKALCFLAISCLIINLVLQAAENFEANWYDMQAVYKKLSTTSFNQPEQLFNHPYWLTTKTEVRDLITGSPKPDFLYHPSLQNAMVRIEFSSMQEYELTYLKHCISTETRQKLELFKETDFGSLPWSIGDFSCTVNTLGHLYYASRVFESSKNQPLNTLIEFGSGFGNLARVFKMTHPGLTLILIDFPELLALQYLYLKSTLPGVSIITHTSTPEKLTPGAIHLVPVYIIEDMNITADCFVSTFALSESTEHLQKIVAKKKFFGSEICYITGQISGWGELNFVNQATLFESIRNQFTDVFCQPFHALSSSFLNSLPSYDILARIQKK